MALPRCRAFNIGTPDRMRAGVRLPKSICSGKYLRGDVENLHGVSRWSEVITERSGNYYFDQGRPTTSECLRQRGTQLVGLGHADRITTHAARY